MAKDEKTILDAEETVLDADTADTTLPDDVATMPDDATVLDGEAASGDESASPVLEQGASLLDTYRIESDAIEGGMGAVWRVHHTGWNVDLAMKRPKSSLFQSEKQKENFVHECEAWINLGLHPHIVSCYYVRDIAGVPSIFSEWMDGGSLKSAIEKGSLYEGNAAERILDIAIQFVRGLHYAHEQGLIHQDVKPDNLLLTKDWDAKVADFGIARARATLTVLDADIPADATIFSASGGYTPAYCSMEQMNGGQLTRRTDIYSWAVSVMEMYLGERPWQNGVIAGAACEEYFPNAKVSIPQKIQDLLKACLNAKETERPHDFAEIEKRLLEIYREETGKDYPRPVSKAAADTSDSLNNRALSFLDLGKPDDAERCWQSALMQNSQHVETIYNQGLLFWRSGRMDDIQLLQRVQSLYAVALNHTEIDDLLFDIHLERCDVQSAMLLHEKDPRRVLPQNLPHPESSFIEIASIRSDLTRKRVYNGLCTNTAPNGHQIANGYDDGRVSILDGQTRREQKTFQAHLSKVTCLAFDTTGEHLLTYGCDPVVFNQLAHKGISAPEYHYNYTIRLWDVSMATFHIEIAMNDRIGAFAFTPDGKCFLSGTCIDGGKQARVNRIEVWNTAVGSARLRLFAEGIPAVKSISFSPDGIYLMASYWDSPEKFSVWEYATGRCLFTFAQPDFASSSGQVAAAFTADNNLVWIGPDDSTWSMPLPKEFYRAKGTLCKIRSFQEQMDLQQRFYSFLAQCRTQLGTGDVAASLKALAQARTIKGFETALEALSVQDEIGKLCQRIGIRAVYAVDEDRLNNQDALKRVLLSPMGYFLYCDEKGRISAVRSVGGEKLFATKLGNQGCGLALSGDGITFAVGGKESESAVASSVIQIFTCHLFQSTLSIKLPSGSGRPTALSFLPDGSEILAGGMFGSISLYSTVDGKRKKTFARKGMENTIVYDIICAPNGKIAYACGEDPFGIAVFCLDSGKWHPFATGDGASRYRLCVSPDGTLIANTRKIGKDWSIEIWNSRGEKLWEFRETKCISAITFIANARYLMATCHEPGWKIWDMDTGKVLVENRLSFGKPAALAISQENLGAYIFDSGGEYSEVRFDWEYQFPGWTNWDESVQPYLEAFLSRNPDFTEEDLEVFIEELQACGYGFIRPEGIKKKLMEIASTREPGKKKFSLFGKKK
ncbi:MAG: protein kinase [Anaerofustis sp.]